MYSLRPILFLGACIWVSIHANVHQGVSIPQPGDHAHELGLSYPVLMQDDSFGSKPAGGNPTTPAIQPRFPLNPAFQSKPGQAPGLPVPSGNASTASASSVPSSIPAPPVGGVLASLVKARDHARPMVEREQALAIAMREIELLPVGERTAYMEIANACRQRLIVDIFLFPSGQAQHGVAPKPKQ